MHDETLHFLNQQSAKRCLESKVIIVHISIISLDEDQPRTLRGRLPDLYARVSIFEM